jgi:hypothetical protein
VSARPRGPRRVLALALALLGAGASLPRPALAQGDCVAPDDSHEAKTFAILSVPQAFTAARPPEVSGASKVRVATVGLEAVYLPRIDSVSRTATLCRPGKGPENVPILPGLLRPRVVVQLPGGVALEGSWVPPVRVRGVAANLFGFAAGIERALGHGGAVWGLRAHATVGKVLAPVTCPDEALDDPNSECFQGQRSDDSYHPNIFGVEGALGWPLGTGRVRPYVGLGYNHMAPHFQVNFTNQFGVTDRRRISATLDRGAIFGGAAWRVATAFDVTGEVYAVPADAVTGRLVLRYAL